MFSCCATSLVPDWLASTSKYGMAIDLPPADFDLRLVESGQPSFKTTVEDVEITYNSDVVAIKLQTRHGSVELRYSTKLETPIGDEKVKRFSIHFIKRF